MLRRVLAGVAAVLASLLLLAVPARALDVGPGCHLEEVDGGPTVTYKVVCPGSGGDDGGPSGGSGGPTCTLTGLATFCVGAAACWMNVPAAVPPDPAQLAAQPSPTAIWVYRACSPDPDGTLTQWFWTEDGAPTPEQLAQQAYGALAAPAFTIGTSPPGRSIVGIPTWFWASTADGGEVRGSSALGVVAIASPAHLEVDPGDGRGVQTCPWSTTDAPTCALTYGRSSIGRPAGPDGLPAYTARMRMVYDVRFEDAGAPLTLPTLPRVFSSPWQALAVPVLEVQSVVTSGT